MLVTPAVRGQNSEHFVRKTPTRLLGSSSLRLSVFTSNGQLANASKPLRHRLLVNAKFFGHPFFTSPCLTLADAIVDVSPLFAVIERADFKKA